MYLIQLGMQVLAADAFYSELAQCNGTFLEEYVPDAQPTAKMIKKAKFEYLEPILSYFSCQ